jgi:hypothetical protein
MRKIHLSVLLFIVSTVMGAIVYQLINHYDKIALYTNITSGLYSKNAVFFSSTDAPNKDFIFIKNELKRNDVFFCEISSSYRSIFFTGNYNLPIISGRFFTNTDFTQENNYIVIGSDHLKNTYRNKGELYLDYNGEVFKVIGVMGLDICSPLDSMILFNHLNIISHINSGMLCVVDNTITKVNLNSDEFHYYDIPVSSALTVYENDIGVKVTILTLLLLASLLWGLLWYTFIMSKKNEIKVCLMCGMKSIEIVKTIFLKDVVLAFICYVLGTVLTMIFENHNPYFFITFIIIFFTMIAFFILLCFLACVYISTLFKERIYDS